MKKHNKKEVLTVKTSELKTRSGWHGVKPYTRVHTPKTAYRRKGRRKEVLA